MRTATLLKQALTPIKRRLIDNLEIWSEVWLKLNIFHKPTLNPWSRPPGKPTRIQRIVDDFLYGAPVPMAMGFAFRNFAVAALNRFQFAFTIQLKGHSVGIHLLKQMKDLAYQAGLISVNRQIINGTLVPYHTRRNETVSQTGPPTHPLALPCSLLHPAHQSANVGALLNLADQAQFFGTLPLDYPRVAICQSAGQATGETWSRESPTATVISL